MTNDPAVAAITPELVDPFQAVVNAARLVVDTFERDEAQGYHSRDRAFAITQLKGPLERLRAALLSSDRAVHPEALEQVDKIIDRLRMRVSQWRDQMREDGAKAKTESKTLIRHALEASASIHEGFANGLECDLEDFEKWRRTEIASSDRAVQPAQITDPEEAAGLIRGLADVKGGRVKPLDQIDAEFASDRAVQPEVEENK